MKNNRSKAWDGLGIPLALSVALLAATAAYLWWKCLHPKGQEWKIGDASEMMTALSVADVGQFVSGITAGLVFIWIIFTYRAQREELSLQREEMQAQRIEFEKLAGEASQQSKILLQTTLMNKRDMFLRDLALRERELALATAEFLRIWASGLAQGQQVKGLWQEYAAGEHHVFYRHMIGLLIRGKHTQFLIRVDAIMGGRELLLSLNERAVAILRDAGKIDAQMAFLCGAMPWAHMAAGLDYILSGKADGTNEVPMEILGQ